MNKILISIVLLLSLITLPAYSQFIGRYAKLPLLENEIDRAVATKQSAPSWQQQLSNIKEQFKYVSLKPELQLGLPITMSSVLSYQDEQNYLRRLLQVQKSVSNNPALKEYTFAAPIPADLVRLSQDNYATLHAFLKNLKVAKVIHTERVRPFTLAVQIKGIPHGALELWLDEPTKKVYLMSDNFYTTSKGKYGLHLH